MQTRAGVRDDATLHESDDHLAPIDADGQHPALLQRVHATGRGLPANNRRW